MSVTLATIVRQICERCGLAAVDVSDLEAVSVHGFQVGTVSDGRSAIGTLRQIGFFDAVESGALVKFPTRGKATVRTLQLADIGAHDIDNQPGASLTTVTAQDVELPRQLFVQYRDPARDYERGQQASPTRLITDAVNDTYIDVAAAIDATQALRASEVLWADQWAGRWRHALSVGAAHMDLEPTDCVLAPVDGRLERMRIVATEDSAGILRAFTLVRDDDGAYVSDIVAAPPAVTPQPLRLYAASFLVLLDLPALRVEDDNAGLYAAARPTGVGTVWPGAAIYRAPAGAPVTPLSSVTNEAIIGTLQAALPAGIYDTWDDGGEIIVNLPRGQFETRPEDEVLGGANTLAIGAHGRWEVVQFVNAVQVGPLQWSLTRLLRGRRGTDHNIGRAQAGDTVVLVSGAGIIRLPLDVMQVGGVFTYRAVTIGATVASGTDQELAGAGEALAPFSPVHVSGEDTGEGDLLIEWTRRDRLALDYEPGEPTPLSEAVEAYEVDILSDASPRTVMRTLASGTPSVVYTLLQQLDDFGSPPPPTVTVRVYQIGSLGRGHYREASV